LAVENTYFFTLSRKVYRLEAERDSLEKVVSELRGKVLEMQSATRIESIARSMGMVYIWERKNVEIETLKIARDRLDIPDSVLARIIAGSAP